MERDTAGRPASGAQIDVPDLVGIAMVREMGAMMAGIILEFLVLPRMIALILMMPLLVLYADFVGILGGAAVGLVS